MCDCFVGIICFCFFKTGTIILLHDLKLHFITFILYNTKQIKHIFLFISHDGVADMWVHSNYHLFKHKGGTLYRWAISDFIYSRLNNTLPETEMTVQLTRFANGVHLSAIWENTALLINWICAVFSISHEKSITFDFLTWSSNTWHNCHRLQFKLHLECDMGWYQECIIVKTTAQSAIWSDTDLRLVVKIMHIVW